MSIIIKLETPVEAFNKKIDAITLKEPTGSLYSRLGEPRVPVYNEKTGHGYWIDQPDVINSYLDRLVEVGDAAATSVVLSTMSLTDMKRVREALFSFFVEAARKAAELKWTTSSSGLNS